MMVMDVDRYGFFSLDEGFLDRFRRRRVEWGYGALSWVTFKRTYSRDNEEWWGLCRRVIEGMFTVQKIHCLECRLPWNETKAQALAQEAYTRMFEFKWTPPGRGLWIMGTRFMYERGGAALNNCGFVSTSNMDEDFGAPFRWMLQMTMLGVGVGFDTRGAGRVTVCKPQIGTEPFVIHDSREGWAEALHRLLSAFVGNGTLPSAWDFSRIRPKGEPLELFGGIASGPEPLRSMLASLEKLYRRHEGKGVDSTLIVDTMNIVGRCVVAGGIRRSAQIAFGRPDDPQFLDLKQDRQKLKEYRWASNNSILAEVGMDYGEVAKRTCDNGEPGYLWLDNAQAYGRMKDPPGWQDRCAEGSNPCMEQTLWDRELCTLVETYPARHQNAREFQATLRLAYLYAKTVTLIPTHDPHTNAVMQRNRRIGCSMTGIVQAVNRFGYRNFMRMCDEAYGYIQRLDKEYSDWLCVPRSIKTTSVKPSGTVSLLAGATPGVHWEHAPYYIRRVRVSKGHPLAEYCRQAGYPVEPDVYSENALVISFPVHVQHLERCKSEVTVREKVDLAAQLQHYWSDNQVSCTADFDPETERKEISGILSAYEDRLKGIVFLPYSGHGYQLPPYEQIERGQYEEMVRRLRPIEGELHHEREQELEASFCEGGTCELC